MDDSRGNRRLSLTTRSGSVIPKTVRMITSIVIVWATVRVRIASPARHLSISRLVICSISTA
jgi:hypothetical protein